MKRSTASPVTLNVRPEVAWFAEMMERKLAINDHKGHWQECSLDYLIRRFWEEAFELEDAVKEGDAEKVKAEAADVANFCMMIADIVRLGPEGGGA